MTAPSYSIVYWIIVIVGAYLIGSIPFGWIVGKLFFKQDIRKGGSGNIGATNALRIYGAKVGFSVLVLDMLKGYAVVYVTRMLVDSPNLIAIAGAAAVLGHVFSIFLGFKGGKGVATAGGIFLALAPIPLAITLVCFIAIVAITKYISVSSILSAICFHILALAEQVIKNTNNIAMVVLTTFVVMVLIYKHQDNMARLLNGSENRFSFKKKHQEMK